MQPVKDEAFEHTPMNDRAPLRDGNDYMIIDYQHRPYHSTPSVSHAAIDDGGGNGFKKPRKTTPASKRKCRGNSARAVGAPLLRSRNAFLLVFAR